MDAFNFRKSYVLFLLISSFASIIPANAAPYKGLEYPFYLGATGGYGRTFWEGLVPLEENIVMSMCTPVNVDEGGILWGLFMGYEVLPSFAVEAAYMRYPNAKVTFNPMSIFTFNHDNMTSFSTHTETYSLMGKILMFIPRTEIRAYSSAGVADIHRSDQVKDSWKLSPTFGVGFEYNITPHIMTEFGGTYTAGYGQSEMSPADDYMPFLYSIFIRFAYRI